MSIFSENVQSAEGNSASECSTNPGAPATTQINPGDGVPGSVGNPRMERPEVHVVERDEEPGGTISLPSVPPPSVVMTTLPVNREARVKAANAVVKQYIILDEEGDKATDAKGREAIHHMLLVGESFEVNGKFDWEAFSTYADKKCGRLRTPPKNPLQRLARVCCPKGTKAPQVTKFGYILAALRQRGITSTNVMAEFAKREPVKDGGPNYTGMDRFVRLHKRDVKEEAGEDEAAPENPFKGFTDKRLAKNAKLLTDELRSRKMLRDGIVDFEGVLNDQAVAKLG
ncbi:hypothetical protein SAMN04487843_101347 [Methylobacterium sp. ap11]|uniref:hypothetical protein n=1 Tax=Methylobacterium sp. ap11 TaxID=1761799 RepID=UPI0008C2F122|nr:hypothetical protein [Methylobacterium sp. ap11]SEO42567.1 hypothetical protein SAMN04487843_101347 [Methylobacterium sp. ap11]